MFRIAGTYKSPSSQSYVFSRRHVWMLELAHKESWAQKNWCFWTVVLEKTLESSVDYKEIKLVNPKGNQSWIFIGIFQWCWGWNSNILATWCEELTFLKRLWCWERLKVGEEGDDKWWDGWMTSLTQWTWVWVNSGCWWWTWKPGVLQSMGWQRVRCDWETELNWTWCLRGVPTDTSGKEPLPANAGDLIYGVLSLGQENPLEEEIATHSSILAWRIPWTEEPGRLQSKRSQRDMTEQSMDTHDRYCGNKTQ